ncbi:nucleo protein TPR [Rhypophila decipiens]|uniref:Nucleo protein TPR n=1 Tax=Rhypophila decipiens TaxID=261697 RepID=A0AAN6YIP8_9PEZI|nr:nucleo protein TPR [Rhypophila decipiens]
MAAAEVDVSYLATHMGVPELNLSTIVTAPTPDLVKAVLAAIITKVQDLEQEKFQLGVELESAIRSSEARCEQFKLTSDKALKEVDELRQKLQNEENARQSLENELHTLKSSGSTSASEIETLRARIASLETSNRETLAIVDSKTQANASLSEDLQKQHQKILKLNQEITSLNQAVQSAQTAANSAKYREDSVKQELELAKRNNEWLDTELKNKSAEALKYRKEKGARIAELQRLNDDLNSNIESLTRSEQVLRKRLSEAQSKADESLMKVQQLQEAAARAEENFNQELEASRRLVELKDQQAETHRSRLKEVELRLEQVKDDNADEVRRIRLELEQEKQDHAQTEQQVQELQNELDRSKAKFEVNAALPGSTPQTPRPNGSYLARPSSPFGTPASIRGKGGLRAAEALEELYNVKSQLANEQRLRKKLQEDLDEVVGLLESKAPEVNELNAESERLKADAIEMSKLMEESFEEREIAMREKRKAEMLAKKHQTEAQILKTQLRDLSTQVHVLIFNIHAQEKGLDQLTEEEAEKFERLQRGEIAEDALDDMSDTHQFITQKFVAFKDIYELQAKNQELLRVTRELADKMESEEALAAKQQAVKDHEEVEELRATVGMLQDEVRSITARMKSYMNERDMFCRMLQQKAHSSEIHEALGSSGAPGQREVLASIEQPADVDLTAALRELQAQFDSYRNDQNVDRKSMKSQIDTLSDEKSRLQSEISRVSSQLTLATERYNMLESNFKAAQVENQELQKRSQILSESAAKQDMRTQQVAEDLVEARALTESLRSENANLKAEKTLWKSIQDRLSQDNENLAQERTRLNNLMSSQQSLLNERELSESETKRRLQSQVDSLEAELTSTKRKLAEEAEEGKKLQLRKEFDAQQFQKRIEELTSTISQVKEENAAIKTTRDHLQARVSELEIELRNAQERAERLRPLPTPRTQLAPGAEQDEEAQARIEELENEVQNLKSSLELVRSQLDNANQQKARLTQLSQEMEDDLNTLHETQEQFRNNMDEVIAGKEREITELNQRVEGLTNELKTSNTELNELRDSQNDIIRRHDEREQSLKNDIARLKDEEQRYKEANRLHQQDLRAQAEIATKAQQDYEQELVRHAEAAKQLQQIRMEHNELKTQAAAWKAEADSARLSLAQGEQSWEERRQQLEQEIAEVTTRREDVNAQNKLLLQQLDNVTAQISSLQQNRSAADISAEGQPGVGADAAAEGLRELNNYLRREKEILEVQYDLKLQETRRLQQQLQYSQSQLDEARLKLDQERRSQSDSARNSLTHKELMDKLNELNLIRESNVTLRNENQRAQAQLEQKNQRIQVLEAKIQPLEARVSELEIDKGFKEVEIKQLQEARDGLQKRIEDILTRRGEPDPHEVEQLKTTIQSLEAERDALQAKITEAETAFGNERTTWKQIREKLEVDFKGRFRAVKTQRDEAISEKSALQTDLDARIAELGSVKKELVEARQSLASLEQRSSQLEQQAAAAASAPVENDTAPAATQPDSELSEHLEILKQELETVKSEKAALVNEVAGLKAELATALAERDAAQADAQTAKLAANSGDVEMQETSAASQVTPVQPSTGLSDEERRALEERIAAAEARAAEFEQKAKELEEHADSIVKQRSDKMKTALNKRLADMKETIQKEVQEERQKIEQEKEKLKADYELKLQQELAIVKAEQAITASANGIPATPVKASSNDVPPTPTAATPSVGELGKLSVDEVRAFINNSTTAKNIIRANVTTQVKKMRDEVEATVKTEYEQKINNAREQASAMSEKKSALRINILDKQSKNAQAKIAVVEKAAKETPEKPVGEVWEIAKEAKPPTPAATTPASGTPAPPSSAVKTPAGAMVTAAVAASSPIAAPAVPVGTPSVATIPEETKPSVQSGIPPPQVATAKPVPSPLANPFGQPGGPLPTTPAAPSPTPSSLPAHPGHPFQQIQQHIQGQAAQQQPQSQLPVPPGRTGIPLPRGGGNMGRGGGAGGRGNFQQGGRGGQGQRGRGGFGRGGSGMNPNAGDFTPGGGGAGNKRPRGDNEGAADRGGKRQRGGGGGQ